MSKQISATVMKKLVVGIQGQILIINFDGEKFTITGRYEKQGWNPCSILFKDPNLLYVINSAPGAGDISLFKLGPDFSNSSSRSSQVNSASGPWTKAFMEKPTLVSSAKGSSGGVHMEFNADKTRIVAACSESSSVDTWDISAGDGSPKLVKSSSIPDLPWGLVTRSGRKHSPRQAVLDPTGRFFIVPDLGGDCLIVIDDAKNAASSNTSYSNVITLPAGACPRRVAFLTNNGTHYLIVLTECSNELLLFEVEYTNDTMDLKLIQREGTWGFMPPGSMSGTEVAELQVAKNQRDVYVSNRLHGTRGNIIAHFVFTNKVGDVQLSYADGWWRSGFQPRIMCLSADDDQEFAFVGSEAGGSGLVALKRNPVTGVIDLTPVATMSILELAAPGIPKDSRAKGPEFIGEI
ncbi:putative isomerase YbhE [Hypoxylon sp. FL0543]|nr:putative isomerase YbhE [Hypoxylon sp. FL0543]